MDGRENSIPAHKHSLQGGYNKDMLIRLCSCEGSLRERLRTHKVFTKDQCFYLNYHKFSIKSYVLDVY